MKYATRGIVLSRESFGEADCYIQFLTRDWGVISTLAKSAKKSKRRYVGGLDLFCHDEIFVRGDPKDKPYLQELTVLNSFQGIRDSLERLMVAGKITQWTKRLANIAAPAPGTYRLLGQTLALIEKEQSPERLELLSLLFKTRLLSQLGLKPRIEDCARCSAQLSGERTFSFEAGGILCENCSPKNMLDEGMLLEADEKEFLIRSDDMKLSQWDDIRFPAGLTNHLSKLLTHFASFHTHTRLPF